MKRVFTSLFIVGYCAGARRSGDGPFGFDVSLIEDSLDFVVHPRQRRSQRMGHGRGVQQVDRAEAWAKDSRMQTGHEQGYAQAVWRERIACRSIPSRYDALQAESSKVIAHACGGVFAGAQPHQCFDVNAQLAVAKAFRQVQEQAQRGKKRHDSRIGEFQSRDALTVRVDAWLSQPLHAGVGQDAIFTETFDFENAFVCVAGNGDDGRQISQAFSDAEVGGIVNRRLRSQCPVLFEVLFDARALVLDVQTGGHAVSDHAGAEQSRRVLLNASGEDELYAVRSAQINVLSNNGFKELASPQGAGEYIRSREFHLPYGQLVSVAGVNVLWAQRPGEPAHPLGEERFDLLGTQSIAEALELFGLRAGQKAVVESFEVNAPLFKLPLGPFVAVDAHAYREGEVRADLDEHRTEVLVVEVEVVLLHEHILTRVIETDVPVAGVLPGLEGHLFLLRHANEDHRIALGLFGAYAVGHLVLSFLAFERNEPDAFGCGEGFHARHKLPCDSTQHSRRRNGAVTLLAQKDAQASRSLKCGHVAVQVDSVKGINPQRRVLLEKIRDCRCLFHAAKHTNRSRRRRHRSLQTQEPKQFSSEAAPQTDKENTNSR